MLHTELQTQDEMQRQVEWHQLNWKAIERCCWKLQKQIYQASKSRRVCWCSCQESVD